MRKIEFQFGVKSGVGGDPRLFVDGRSSLPIDSGISSSASAVSCSHHRRSNCFLDRPSPFVGRIETETMASRDNRVHVRAWSGRAGFRFSENQLESGLVALVTPSFDAVIRALTSVHARGERFFFLIIYSFLFEAKFRINRMEEEGKSGISCVKVRKFWVLEL